MKKLTALLLIVMMLLCLAACGKKDEKEAAAKPATPQEVYAKMEEQVTFPEKMVRLSDEDLLNTFGFETENFEEFVYVICENILLAENIVLVKVKDGVDPETVKKTLSEYVSDQTMMLESYVPEQAVVAKKSVVGVKGDFVYMIMSSKVTELEKIVNEMVTAK